MPKKISITLKQILFISFIIITAVLGSMLLFVAGEKKELERQFEKKAVLAASFSTPGLVRDLHELKVSAYTRNFIEQLIKENSELKDITLIDPDGWVLYSPGNMFVINEQIRSASILEVIHKLVAGPEKISRIRQGKILQVLTISYDPPDDSVPFIVVYTFSPDPFPDSKGGYFKMVILRGVFFLLLFLFPGIIAAYFFSRTITVPIARLVSSVHAMEKGDLHVVVHESGPDELGDLAQAFNSMARHVSSSFENEKERQSLIKEMELAKKIQTSLLPEKAECEDFEIAAVMLPAEQVGGDFYDITYDRNGSLWIGIGDVTGHGVTPGLVMMMTQTVFNTFQRAIGRSDTTPRDIYLAINDVLYDNVRNRLHRNHHMTLNILKHIKNGTFMYTGAHLDIIIHRKKTGVFERVPTPGMWVNLKRDISDFTQNKIFYLEQGDTVLLYTDGIIEVNSQAARKAGDLDFLGTKGLIYLAGKYIDKDVDTLKEEIIRETMAYCNNTLDDDITLVVLRKK